MIVAVGAKFVFFCRKDGLSRSLIGYFVCVTVSFIYILLIMEVICAVFNIVAVAVYNVAVVV